MKSTKMLYNIYKKKKYIIPSIITIILVRLVYISGCNLVVHNVRDENEESPDDPISKEKKLEKNDQSISSKKEKIKKEDRYTEIN